MVTWVELHRFEVPGPPVGYYAHGARPNHTRHQAYVAYKRHVQVCAMAAGVRLPLVATHASPLLVETEAYFEHGTHADPENVRKGITDALFYSREARGSADKHTGGAFPPPLYDPANPRVVVVVKGRGA